MCDSGSDLRAAVQLIKRFDNSLAIFVGGTFWKLKNEDQSAQYFTSDFESTEDMVDYGLQLVQQVEAEGAALLMNENNALPLAEGANVSLFSNSSVNLVYGGTGSGNIDASTADTLKTAMEKTGFMIMKHSGTSMNPRRWECTNVEMVVRSQLQVPL